MGGEDVVPTLFNVMGKFWDIMYSVMTTVSTIVLNI